MSQTSTMRVALGRDVLQSGARMEIENGEIECPPSGYAVFMSNLEDAKRELERVQVLHASLCQQIDRLPYGTEEGQKLTARVVELEINMAELELEIMRLQW